MWFTGALRAPELLPVSSRARSDPDSEVSRISPCHPQMRFYRSPMTTQAALTEDPAMPTTPAPPTPRPSPLLERRATSKPTSQSARACSNASRTTSKPWTASHSPSRRRRNTRPRRRIRLRQDHRRTHPPPPHPRNQRHRPPSTGTMSSPPAAQELQAPPPQHADRLPGPRRLAQPDACASRPDRFAEPLVIHGVVDRTKTNSANASEITPRTLRHAPPSRGRPLPPRVLRRPTPTHRHRAGVGARAQVHRVRRADERARCVDPGADHQPARRTCRPSSG